MISKSFGLLFYLKKQHGDGKVHRPIYLRITVDGVMKEMSIHRSWDRSDGTRLPAELFFRRQLPAVKRHPQMALFLCRIPTPTR